MISKRRSRSLGSLQLRHRLRSGSNSRGLAEMDSPIPITGDLKVQVEWFSGNGESPINHNFKRTHVGLGVSRVEWR